MKLGRKKQQKTEITKPYMSRVMTALNKNDIPAAYQLIQESAIDYFNRFSPATDTIPTDDAAILICLYRHMANELERAVSPETKKVVKALGKIPLPAIEYQKK
jgi:hypothetical protein